MKLEENEIYDLEIEVLVDNFRNLLVKYTNTIMYYQFDSMNQKTKKTIDYEEFDSLFEDCRSLWNILSKKRIQVAKLGINERYKQSILGWFFINMNIIENALKKKDNYHTKWHFDELKTYINKLDQLLFPQKTNSIENTLSKYTLLVTKLQLLYNCNPNSLEKLERLYVRKNEISGNFDQIEWRGDKQELLTFIKYIYSFNCWGSRKNCCTIISKVFKKDSGENFKIHNSDLTNSDTYHTSDPNYHTHITTILKNIFPKK